MMNTNHQTAAARGRPSSPAGMASPVPGSPAAPDEIGDLLRPLARKAVGMSGADVERIVREARSKARRERRQMAWDDLAALLDATRPPMTDELRWRVAIHEAGHAVVRLALERGRISMITIDSATGGFVKGRNDVIETQTEAWVMHRIAVCLAGRAAELEFLGDAAAGAGGSAESDLGHATALALSLETEVGFSSHLPLVYRKAGDGTSSLIYHQGLAEAVNARLMTADRMASDLVRHHRPAVEMLARELMVHLTLEGEQLNATLARIAAVMQEGAASRNERPADDTRRSDHMRPVHDCADDPGQGPMTDRRDRDSHDAGAGERGGLP